ncbi:MAG TPA: trehalose-phosphatase [Kofleriaceae bacterium]|nr:trehalose-phosphatase [Kofleriaceae bacterium]
MSRPSHLLLVLAVLLAAAASPSTAFATQRGGKVAAARTARAKAARQRLTTRPVKAARPIRPRHWRSMMAALDPSKPIVLISDHDDTLVPSWKLTKAPAANMSPKMKRLLARAARRTDTDVVISSGSPLHKLEVFYDGVDADLLGNFGMQTRVGGQHGEDPVARRARRAVTRTADAAEALALQQGLSADVVRRKGTSLSFHQGTMSEAAWHSYRDALLPLIAQEPKLEAHVKGESVEVVPKGAGSKRVSLERWLASKHGPDWRGKVNLVYVGDSGGKGGGDEPAFKFVTEHGGVGILVRHGSAHDPDTAARHYAKDMNDVERLVGWVAGRRGPRAKDAAR